MFLHNFNPNTNIAIFHPFRKHIRLLCYHYSANSWSGYQVFQDGGFFIKSLFGFLLREEDFIFNTVHIETKGKVPQVISEILVLLHVL